MYNARTVPLSHARRSPLKFPKRQTRREVKKNKTLLIVILKWMKMGFSPKRQAQQSKTVYRFIDLQFPASDTVPCVRLVRLGEHRGIGVGPPAGPATGSYAPAQYITGMAFKFHNTGTELSGRPGARVTSASGGRVAT